MKILIIIEELGSITTSGAIVNWNLSKLIDKEIGGANILTLDNVASNLKDDFSGTIYTHKKNNLTKFRELFSKKGKIKGFLSYMMGNDISHFIRVLNIRKFVKKHFDEYEVFLLLSGGTGFTPHHAFSKINILKNKKIISVYHDSYPSSCYPKAYSSGSKKLDFIKIKNTQKCIDNSDFVIFPSLKLFEWYLKDYKISDEKYKIIPHAIEYNFEVIKTQKKDVLNIVHAGLLMKQRNPITLLRVINKLDSNKLLFESFGPVSKELLIEINSCLSPTVNFYNERIPYDNALNKLINSDFTLLIESDAEDNPFLPTKFVDYVNIYKPIIALTSSKSEVARLLGNDYPFIANLNDEETIYKIFNEYIYDKDKVDISLKIINQLKLYFSKEYILNSYKEILLCTKPY